MKNIALALGQIEEAMGQVLDAYQALIASRIRDEPVMDLLDHASLALMRAREFLDHATAAEAARVPVAFYTPITAEEVERQS